MNYYNKILITVGLISVLFQSVKSNSFTDAICLISSIGTLLIIVYVIKNNLTTLYNNYYKKLSTLSLLVFINNIIIYLNIPQKLLISFKILLSILLFLNIHHILKYKYNINIKPKKGGRYE